ncbi:MAG: LuxR C-terminal-related transcriptional regulator [Proteobacteria bacterium]|nr:LuxR C-terminal-related transcriptional regulator [Pseudomonadota bacterium]
MHCSVGLPWIKIHNLLQKVGNERTPKELCLQMLNKIYSLIPYDQALIYFLNDKGKVYDQVLLGVGPKWSKAYLEYYSKIEDSRYSYLKFHEGLKDWSKYGNGEFITDFIKPQRINYSVGYRFYSPDHCIKSIISIDRTSSYGFSQLEMEILSIIQTHIANLHTNLFVAPSANSNCTIFSKSEEPLTKRESEIAGLLCKGMTPIQIGKNLFLSRQTVYKHIANIHKKLNVSNRQELLLKLLNRGGNGDKGLSTAFQAKSLASIPVTR